ncbi:MAG TPA: type II toxin-antitoxin system VapC family toxin [Roseiarcus sp.]|nr:type II toxin-antitoxin system VapC family toxin [Roseiarcus sp.]
MSSFALDSSAILALINNEPGSDIVVSTLPQAIISAVNIAEIVPKLIDLNTSMAPLEQALAEANVEIVPFTDSQARLAGDLRRATKSRGLSLGDRACLALAQERGLTAVTADTAWAGATAIPVLLIRPVRA